jgi:hypothetical protein
MNLYGKWFIWKKEGAFVIYLWWWLTGKFSGKLKGQKEKRRESVLNTAEDFVGKGRQMSLQFEYVQMLPLLLETSFLTEYSKEVGHQLPKAIYS